MSDLAFLEEDDAPEPAANPAPEPAPAPQTADPAPAPESPADPAAEPPPKPVVPEGYVPEARLMSEVDRRRRLEDENQRLRGLATPVEYLEPPDPVDDPRGYNAYQSAQTDAKTLNVKLDLSEDIVRTAQGDELVDRAKNWALQRFGDSPAYREEVLRHRNPYGKVVSDFQREQTLAELTPSDIEAFRTWKAAQAGHAPVLAAGSPASPSFRPNAPPPSLAGAPSAGGVAVQVEEEPFDAEFRRKK